MNMNKKITVFWIIFMFLFTFTCSLTYLVTQQALRLGANELPAQLAVDTALKLQEGKNASSIVPVDKIDISKSLDTFIMVFDNNKNLQASSATLEHLSYPKSVLDHAAQKDGERVTWQPKTGLRFASVAMKYNNGYIVAARSLHETENLIDRMGRLILMAWLSCLVFSTIALIVINVFIKKIPSRR